MKLGRHVHCVEGDSQLVLTMPHSGTAIPGDLEHNLDLRKEHVRRTLNAGVDYCVPFVTGFHEYDSATRIWTTLPRVVIDVNRTEDNVDKYSVEGSNGVSNPHGLFWRSSFEQREEDIRPTLVKPYTQEECETLLREAHRPYIDAQKDAVQRALDRHGTAVVFALHSMPGVLPAHVKEGMHANAYVGGVKAKRGHLAEGKLPDLVILDNQGKSCSPELSIKLMDLLRSHGLIVDRMNVAPQTVTSPVYELANPEKGVHVIGIETSGLIFEPKRMEGVLEYNPAEEAKFRAAYKDAFAFLESFPGAR